MSTYPSREVEVKDDRSNSDAFPESRSAEILFEHVSYQYVNLQTGESVHALENVNLEIYEREFICVVGPSGCGKSTLLRLIAGLLKPTKGRVLVAQKEVKGPGADRGLVFQEYALLPWKTVRENVELGLKFRGIEPARRREIGQTYLDLVGLTGFEKKYPYELSGGMSQRVAVARTLANSPQVMLMDEPFAAVDAQTRTTLQNELAKIWEDHRITVMFVTHNVDESIMLGDRVVVVTPRPGSIKGIIPVNIPRSERNWQTLEENPEFHSIKTRISDLLHTPTSVGATAN